MKRILIIDDEPLIIFALAKTLDNGQREVFTATNGTEGLKLLSEKSFDLCLLDIYLPDISGLDIMNKVREISPDTKIIIMTASNLSSDEKESIKRGAIHFITKPFRINDIKVIVKHSLEELDEMSEDLVSYVDKGLKNTRKYERTHVEQKFSYSFEKPDADGTMRLVERTCLCVDKSINGVGIWTDTLLTKGSLVYLNTESEHKKGIVVWSKLTDDKLTCRAGIRFV